MMRLLNYAFGALSIIGGLATIINTANAVYDDEVMTLDELEEVADDIKPIEFDD